jgi:hypothetical protein
MKNSKMFKDLKVNSLTNGIDLSIPEEPVINPTKEQVQKEIEKALGTGEKSSLTECKKIEAMNTLTVVEKDSENYQNYFDVGFVSTDSVEANSDKAIKINGMWIPKSLCAYTKNKYSDRTFLIRKWFANKNSLKVKLAFDFTPDGSSEPKSSEPKSSEPTFRKRKVKTTTTFASTKNWKARSLAEQLPLREKKKLIVENLLSAYNNNEFVLLGAAQDLDVERPTARALLINGIYIPKANAVYKQTNSQLLVFVKKWWYEKVYSDLVQHDLAAGVK